jgi:hypothetical protein
LWLTRILQLHRVSGPLDNQAIDFRTLLRRCANRMPDDTTYFFGPGVRAAVSGHGGRCLLEIVVERTMHPAADCVRLEVLYQGRGYNGLAIGAPATLHRAELPLSSLPGCPVARARVWLPQGLVPETARNCHFRVVPAMMRIDPDQDEINLQSGADAPDPKE